MYTITSIKENPLLDFSVTAFPKPTSDFISLKVDASTSLSTRSSKVNFPFERGKGDVLQFTVTYLTGKILQTGKFLTETEQINFSNYAVGSYII